MRAEVVKEYCIISSQYKVTVLRGANTFSHGAQKPLKPALLAIRINICKRISITKYQYDLRKYLVKYPK